MDNSYNYFEELTNMELKKKLHMAKASGAVLDNNSMRAMEEEARKEAAGKMLRAKGVPDQSINEAVGSGMGGTMGAMMNVAKSSAYSAMPGEDDSQGQEGPDISGAINNIQTASGNEGKDIQSVALSLGKQLVGGGGSLAQGSGQDGQGTQPYDPYYGGRKGYTQPFVRGSMNVLNKIEPLLNKQVASSQENAQYEEMIKNIRLQFKDSAIADKVIGNVESAYVRGMKIKDIYALTDYMDYVKTIDQYVEDSQMLSGRDKFFNLDNAISKLAAGSRHAFSFGNVQTSHALLSLGYEFINNPDPFWSTYMTSTGDYDTHIENMKRALEKASQDTGYSAQSYSNAEQGTASTKKSQTTSFNESSKNKSAIATGSVINGVKLTELETAKYNEKLKSYGDPKLWSEATISKLQEYANSGSKIAEALLKLIK